jgi:hypothetical protein
MQPVDVVHYVHLVLVETGCTGCSASFFKG